MKITNLDTPFYIDVKRFYVPCGIEDVCPTCGQIVQRDSDDYLSYPVANTPIDLNFYHGDCPKNPAGTEWRRRVILKITLESVPAQDSGNGAP